MEKVIYVLWGDDDLDRPSLRKHLLDDVAPQLLELGVQGLSMNIDDEDADVAGPVQQPPHEDPHLATISVWVDAYDRRRLPVERAIHGVGLRTHGYVVSESIYTDYGDTRWAGPRDWPDGQRSPGILTVALLRRPADYDPLAWIRHWHGVQSPESAQIQPRTRYVRNAVVFPVDDNAPVVHGIVDEAWPSRQHVEDPMLFYCAGSDPARCRANIERMIRSVTGFLDLEELRSNTMSEYLLKTPSAS